MKISDEVLNFFLQQTFVIVSTLDAKGNIHCSAKGLIDLTEKGIARVADLYTHTTFKNIQRNPLISLTAVDEYHFLGYTLQGQARIIPYEKISSDLFDSWEAKIVSRISQRVIKSVQQGKKSKYHYEMDLPHRPQYLIEIKVKNIINLARAKYREQ